MYGGISHSISHTFSFKFAYLHNHRLPVRQVYLVIYKISSNVIYSCKNMVRNLGDFNMSLICPIVITVSKSWENSDISIAYVSVLMWLVS